MTYDLVWNGKSLRELGFRVSSFSSDPPEPKLTIVSIPGGVDLDLTDALTGHAAYENRDISVSLFYDGRGMGETWQEAVNKLSALLHGAEADFTLGWDPGHTYHGRAYVTDVEHSPQFYCTLTVQIAANPWKLRESHVETVSALGYAELVATCGTRPVHPVISCEYPVVVTLRGRSVTVPAGERYRVVGLTLLPGENELLLQMFSYEQATWADLSGMTWAELSGRRWGDLWVTDEPVTPEGGLPGSPDVTVEWEEYYL